MKLFTIFTSDDRALEHVRAERRRIAAVVKRVANHQEWGVRVVLDRDRAVAAAPRKKKAPAGRDDRVSPTSRARKRSATRWWSWRRARARPWRRCTIGWPRARGWRNGGSPSELPVQGGPLLLDAAFLVPRARAASFQALASRESRALARHGYGLTFSGPWPPYSFVQD